jgi:hypothetical protein
MIQMNFPIEGIEKITVRSHADLYVEGTDQQEVGVKAEYQEEVNVERQGSALQVTCRGDVWLAAPKGVGVEVNGVSGDLKLRGLPVWVKVTNVSGDLQAEKLQGLSVTNISGDCEISAVDGNINISNVSGDLSIGNVGGDVVVTHVSGDAKLGFIKGLVAVRSSGDLNAAFGDVHGSEVTLSTSGDLDLSVSKGVNAHLEITSQGHDIKLNLHGNRQEIEQKYTEAKLGDGSAAFHLQASGDVEVSDDPSVLKDLEDELKDMVDDWKDFVVSIPVERIIKGIDMEKIRKSAEGASARAEEASKRANERIQEAMRRFESRSARWGESVGAPTAGAAPAMATEKTAEPAKTSPVSDEERSMILKMLQEKKITVEEAEKLFETLEGQPEEE